MKLTPQLKPVAFNAKTTTAPVNSSFGRLPTDLQGADLEALARFNQALPAAPKGSRRLLKKPGEQDDLQALSETVTDSPEWELAQAEVGAAAAGSSGAAGTGAAAASAAEVGAAGAGGAGAAGAVSIVSPLAFVPALAVPAVGSGGGDTPRINTVPVVQATDVTGAVTELVTPEGNLTDSGTIGFTDVDLSDLHTVSEVSASEGALGTLDVSVSTGTDDATGLGGVVTWNYSVAAAAVEYIAAGETKTETFTFNLLDGNGGSVERTVSVTITGTNDVPVVEATDVTGAVTELITPEGNLTDSGTIAFTDVDLSDLHTVSEVSASEGALGTLEVSVSTGTDDATGLGGIVTWNYSVAAAAVEYIAAGETKTETFTFNLLDGEGGSVERIVSITITGTNDVPVVEATDVTGAVTELITPEGNLTDSGTIAFTDVDLSDLHTVSEVSASEGALGTLEVSVSTGTDDATGLGGIVTWNYSVAAAAVEYIAAGETKTETFTFNLLDGNGGSVERTVSVTITGTNDVPVVEATDVTGAVTELVTPEGNLTDSGTIAFTDVDLSDVHTVSEVSASEGALGTLEVSVSTGTDDTTGLGGIVTWNYSVAAAAVEYIAAGETKTETFTFNLLDGNGGSVERTVSVTITGTNDVPVVEATDVTGAVTELVTPEGNLTDSGTIAFTDVDLSDLHTVSEVSASEGALGTLDVSVSTGTDDTTGLGGIVTWNYSVAAAAVEYIAAGETKTETFTFNLLDGNGGSVERTVSVTITGTNDKPILSLEQGTIYASVNAEAGAIGCVVVSATDVDVTDELTYHFLVAGERSLTSQNGYFAIDPTTGQISLTKLGQTSAGADLNDLPNSSYDVVVVAYDGHANSDPQTLTIERVLPDLLPGGVPDTLYRLSDMLAPVDEAYAYASEQVAVTVVLPEIDNHDQDDDDEVIEDARVVEIVIDDTLSVDPDGRSFDILELDAHIPSIDTENAPVLGEVGELEELGASREHDDLVVEFQAVGGPAVVVSVKQHFDNTVNGNLEYVRFAHNTTFAGYQLSSNADEVLNSCDETFSPENGAYLISNQRSAVDGETLLGTSYNDLIAGSEEFTEVLSGGLGNDLLFASGDLGDTLIGGAGDDLLVLDGHGVVVQFEAAASNGLDTVVGFDATQHIHLNAIDTNQQVEGVFTFAAGSWSDNTSDLAPAAVVAISSLAGGDELNVRLQDLGAETLNVFALGQDNAGASLFFLVESSVGDDEANTLLYQAFDADGDGFLKGSEFTHMATFDHAGIADFSAANVSYMNPSFIA